MANNPFNLDEVFYESCLNISRQVANQLPTSTTSTLVSSTGYMLRKRDLHNSSVVSKSSLLTDRYPAAYTDFFGMPSNPPCIYKSGPAWPVPQDPHALRYIREARPVYGHPIMGAWSQLGLQIGTILSSRGIEWTTLDPLAFANSGEKKPFCPFLIWIGVKPDTLDFDDAVTAADAIKDFLTQAGFPNIEVAFRESVVTYSVVGPKLLPFKPLTDRIPEFRKPFTPTLGLSISRLEAPCYEGTGALYFRLSKESDRVALLTAAHVVRLPSVSVDKAITHKDASQPSEQIVAPGTKGYQDAKDAIKVAIGNLGLAVPVWNDVITRLGEFVEGEDEAVIWKRRDTQNEVENATRLAHDLSKLHNEDTNLMRSPDDRVIGFVLHADPITFFTNPRGFTRDWAFIELYNEKIDWNNFQGNKVYVGGNFPPSQFGQLMFPQPEDRAGYQYPRDGLLQAYGVVQDDEIRQPRHLDAHGEKALLVVKNGLTTGTTIGRVNGLVSFTRVYPSHGIEGVSIETAILPYDKQHAPFSASGDSGAIILDRAGRIVALLTGGSGATDTTDITYATPYWWLEQEIKKTFPGCHLYEVVN